MRGVVLAGGEGTRLRPATEVTNKHLLPVYDKLMIEYPIETLKELGVDEIVLVSGGEHIGDFAEYLHDGSDFGVDITYRVQNKAGGIAEALKCAHGFTDGVFPVILGDNYFETTPQNPNQPAIFIKNLPNPERFGVYNPISKEIVEKPRIHVGNDVVTGLYFFDDRVYEMIEELEYSDRGELEITDINNRYLKLGCAVMIYSDYWSDMGTHKSLLDVARQVSR